MKRITRSRRFRPRQPSMPLTPAEFKERIAKIVGVLPPREKPCVRVPGDRGYLPPQLVTIEDGNGRRKAASCGVREPLSKNCANRANFNFGAMQDFASII